MKDRKSALLLLLLLLLCTILTTKMKNVITTGGCGFEKLDFTKIYYQYLKVSKNFVTIAHYLFYKVIIKTLTNNQTDLEN